MSAHPRYHHTRILSVIPAAAGWRAVYRVDTAGTLETYAIPAFALIERWTCYHEHDEGPLAPCPRCTDYERVTVPLETLGGQRELDERAGNLVYLLGPGEDHADMLPATNPPPAQKGTP